MDELIKIQRQQLVVLQELLAVCRAGFATEDTSAGNGGDAVLLRADEDSESIDSSGDKFKGNISGRGDETNHRITEGETDTSVVVAKTDEVAMLVWGNKQRETVDEFEELNFFDCNLSKDDASVEHILRKINNIVGKATGSAENESMDEGKSHSTAPEKRKTHKRKKSREKSSKIKCNKWSFGNWESSPERVVLLIVFAIVFVSIAFGQKRGNSIRRHVPSQKVKLANKASVVGSKEVDFLQGLPDRKMVTSNKGEKTIYDDANSKKSTEQYQKTSRTLQFDYGTLLPSFSSPSTSHDQSSFPTFDLSPFPTPLSSPPPDDLDLTPFPTYKPNPFPVFVPTLSPSKTNSPTSSFVPTDRPSLSSPPTSSYSPTIPCMNLTVTMTSLESFLPYKYDSLHYGWVLFDGWRNPWPNLTDCLPEGRYSVSFFTDQFDAWFAMFLDNHQLECGFVPFGDFSITATFSVPPEQSLFENTGCSTDDGASPEQEFDALQCYWSAVDNFWQGAFTVNKSSWFDENCGPVLEHACLTKLPLGFQEESLATLANITEFCEYHQCAYAPFLNESVGGYRDCECLFLEWKCSPNGGGGYCDNYEELDCCQSGGSGCECTIRAECENGDEESCNIFEQYCCKDRKNGCDCDFVQGMCIESLEKGSVLFCDDVHEACLDEKCQDEVVIPQCDDTLCGFWEPLCTKYKGYSCQNAVDECCGGSGVSSVIRRTDYFFDYPHCVCDFYNFASETLGYEFSEKYFERDVPCSQAKDDKSDPEDELLSLEQFFTGTRGDFWLNNSGWMTDVPHCKWYGVSCLDGKVDGLNLRSNNLTGNFLGTGSVYLNFTSYPLGVFSSMRFLDISGNKLSGTINYFAFFGFRNLINIDISQNNFSGEADALFSPSALYVNASHNNFSSVATFRSFKRSHRTLRTFDASYNKIQQNATQILLNLPVDLEELVLSNNMIQGSLPDVRESADRLKRFEFDNNLLSGKLPELQRSFPNLRLLGLSNQSDLMGPIPASIFNLVDLSVLDLSHNAFTKTIPPEMVKSTQPKRVLLASNMLSGTIPSELGMLSGTIEEFDASNNGLDGSIPSELGTFVDARVNLRNNSKLFDPSPLSLCLVDGFDLRRNANKCPAERNALKAFYDSTKGQEWTNSSLWLHEYKIHCSWYGITCQDENGTVVNMTLSNNGLSGKLGDSIKGLASLEILDLGDNDIKGYVPSEIGSLSKLTYLRISHNSFMGKIPQEFEYLQNLELVHLHGNRLSGTLPLLNRTFSDPFSFIADCGVPTDYDEALDCSECTMCCNIHEECYPKTEKWVQEDFDSYLIFTSVYFAGILVFSLLLGVLYFLFYRFKEMSDRFDSSRRSSFENIEENSYAIIKLGEKSVYRFFLSKHWLAWTIALAVMGVQIWVLFAFVKGAEYDLNDDNSDLVYTFRCPRDGDECKDEANLGISGWVIFSILMVSHLLKDIVNGFHLMKLCVKGRRSTVFTQNTRIRFFIGGMLLTVVTSFTLFVSAIYNKAIATSNTEIIINAVVILFVTDLDEQFFELCQAVMPNWIRELKKEQRNEFGQNSDSFLRLNDDLRAEVQIIKNELLLHRDTMGMLTKQFSRFNATSADPQDDRNNESSQ